MNLLEWVPKNPHTLVEEIEKLLSAVPQLSGINIPDILRLPTRSYTATATLLKKNILAIPHIRICDQTPIETLGILSPLIQSGLTHVLLVTGDNDPGQHSKATLLDTIQTVKNTHPALKIYGALDPYRSSIQTELHYAHSKLNAGADGLFTQPFFDPKQAETYLDKLTHTQIFLGISPVTTEKSKHYWETRNKVTFPPQFSLTLHANVTLAQTLIQLTKTYTQNTYIMPITLSPLSFAELVFNYQEQHLVD